MQAQASEPRLAFPGPPSAAARTPSHGQQAQDQGQDAQAQPQPQQQNWDAVPDNPRDGGLPPLLIQAWPHIWLIFRLCVFVWFFTSPYSSWSRWVSVIGLAVGIFIYSIGAMQHIGELLWRPVARHLENMLPRLEQPERDLARGGQGQDGQNPDPADLAARLIAQRQRENWVQTQIRRLERAGLLFLASIAPGVVEDHIRRLEEEARAERARLEAAEAERREQSEATEAESREQLHANTGAESQGPLMNEHDGSAEEISRDGATAAAGDAEVSGASDSQGARNEEANTGGEQASRPNLVAA